MKEFVAVAQWIAYQTSDLGVAGSSPAGNIFLCLCFCVAQVCVCLDAEAGVHVFIFLFSAKVELFVPMD